MDAIDCLKTRRSVRRYQDKPIPVEVMEDIIDCARLAPSANNIQPWRFIVVTDRAMLAKLADITDHGPFIRNAAACVVVVCEDSKYYLEDGCAATQNILLAARAYGIGSCWVAGDKKAYCDEIMRLLGVPTGHKLISLLALGYTDQFSPGYGKKELKDVLHWERF